MMEDFVGNSTTFRRVCLECCVTDVHKKLRHLIVFDRDDTEKIRLKRLPVKDRVYRFNEGIMFKTFI
jgi:hypothetical protein